MHRPTFSLGGRDDFPSRKRKRRYVIKLEFVDSECTLDESRNYDGRKRKNAKSDPKPNTLDIRIIIYVRIMQIEPHITSINSQSFDFSLQYRD